MIDITRPDNPNMHDIFDVDPSGIGWHTVIEVGLTVAGPHILYNDKLPGSWSRFLRAEWSADHQTLYAYGRGWLNGKGGTTFYVAWNSVSQVWSDPVKEPLKQ
jgi:hypothetical protein